MDFYKIKERSGKNGVIEVYPDFLVKRSKDLMVRGKSFYGVWDEKNNIWSTDEYDIQSIVDEEIDIHKAKVEKKSDGVVKAKYMHNFSSNSWVEFRRYLANMSDNSHELDSQLTFANTEIKRKDYVSKRLDYNLQEGDFGAWDEIIGTLYDPIERDKLEWAIGSVIAGDSKNIQKFIVLFGDPGSGKGTILNIIQKLFKGYYTTFEAKALTGNSNSFSTDVFRTNPLVAIQHDGDLSKIEDNTKLNSIISHEEMTLNEKYKPSYTSVINAFLFMGTNKAVKISDAKSGIIRRLIDVVPSGRRLTPRKYQTLFSQIDFELGAIASHCHNRYLDMGRNYYEGYKPTGMMLRTDIFFNFIESYYFTFKDQDGVSLKQAYEMYKIYCDEAIIQYKMPRHAFREELKSYFSEFLDVTRIDNKQVRSYYQGFRTEKMSSSNIIEDVVEEHAYSLVMNKTESIFDEHAAEYPAQYGSSKETPRTKWSKVKTKLSDIDTNELHYVALPVNHIVIDFDKKDVDGNKSLELNLEAASKWPSTYAELSKSGNGIHLHYIYEGGDPEMLSRIYEEDIEIKVFVGDSSLRRKLSKCNSVKIAAINSGLPLKGEKMVNFEGVRNEQALRTLIEKNIRKEIHPGTKPSVDFIFKILEDAYESGINYDVSDLAQSVLVFASNSTNQSDYCINRIVDMKWKSDEPSVPEMYSNTDEIVFFDVEVYPNLFVIVWKYRGKEKYVRMINPTAEDVEPLLRMMIVGFNCRRYDNHILYARYIGFTLDQLYNLSQKIIKNEKNALFAEAYNLSYADIYDYSLDKKSLKKWQIELGINHVEMDIPWDEPVPEDMWEKVVEYCVNDVMATEALFEHILIDFDARLILSKISGLTPNDTTQRHTAKILFGNDRQPQKKFIYTDLSETFPGYEFKLNKSTYRGEKISEGGQVWSKPGMYGNVGLFDIASQHPTSGIIMRMFGEYTDRYEELYLARLDVKHGDVKSAGKRLGGILKPFLNNPDDLPKLAEGLKRALNIIYGMSSAKFDNPFKDPRNKDNIMAKRGALFMVDLRLAVEAEGYEPIHIKTDSIKVADADDHIREFIVEFGRKYGYEFEHEATYEKLCLVNDAVYIGKIKWNAKNKNIGKWTATGTQFAQPYVYKTLFSNEKIEFKDMCEVKSVKSTMFLDMNEHLLGDTYESDLKEYDKIHRKLDTWQTKDPYANKYLNDETRIDLEYRLKELEMLLENKHDYHFIGKVGLFSPVISGAGGGVLVRASEGKYHAVTGTKGYRWLESNLVKSLNKEEEIDHSYYISMVDDAIDNIGKYGDFEWFRSNDKYTKEVNGIYPF